MAEFLLVQIYWNYGKIRVDVVLYVVCNLHVFVTGFHYGFKPLKKPLRTVLNYITFIYCFYMG